MRPCFMTWWTRPGWVLDRLADLNTAYFEAFDVM